MDEQQLNQQVNDLLAQVQPPEPIGNGAVQQDGGLQRIGDLPIEQFQQALEAFTGGAVKDPAQIKSYITAAAERDQFASKLREFEAKSQVSPFASPLAEKVNQMLSSGAQLPEIRRFIEMQSLDVETMSGTDAYKCQLSIKYPTLNAQQIDLLVQDEFGLNVEEGETPNPVALLKLERAGLDAKEFLRQQKVAAENPQALQQKQQAEAQALQLRNGWSQVVGKVTQDFSRDIRQKFDDGDYSFKYKYSQEALDAATKMAVEQAVANKIPLDHNGYGQVVDFIHKMATAIDFEKLQTALLSDAFAKARIQVTQSTAGGPPPPVRQAAPPPIAASGNGKVDLSKLIRQ